MGLLHSWYHFLELSGSFSNFLVYDMTAYYLRLARYLLINDEVVFSPNRSFGVHVFFNSDTTGLDIANWAYEAGYILLGSAKMVYIPSDKDTEKFL